MVRLHKVLDATRTGSEAEKLEVELRSRIVGQDEAISQVVSVYQSFLAGMSAPGRPIGNFLFLGPTGTGKTRLVEALAETLFNDPRAVVKIDCGEFQHSHEVAKLIGSPPGYLGHKETHPLLSQEALNRFHTEKMQMSFVLFDEIEKASDALWNLLLGILDKATLTLGDNRRVDFSRCMIFLTSNLGSGEMETILRPGMGFARATVCAVDEKLSGKISRVASDAARRRFTPEFMNRLDKVVVFRPLEEADLRRILDLELNLLRRRILDSPQGTPFVFSVTDAAKTHMLQEGADARYGARHLKRAIERALVQRVSNLLATEQVRRGDWIRVDFDPRERQMAFYKEAENLPMAEMAQLPMMCGEDEQAAAQAAEAAEPSAKPVRVRSSRRA